MKAKEYFKRLNMADDRDSEFARIGKDFVLEFVDIVKKRNIQKVDSVRAVFIEHEKKWQNLAHMINTKIYPQTKPIRYDGFRRLIKDILPELGIRINI